jgi:hypothetical protein
MKDQMSTQLPTGKTIVDVFADFMGYLFDSTRTFFKTSEPNGEIRWNSISNSIELVLTHPNGWGGPQQAQLRTAAIRAGIVPDTPAGRSRVQFVSEGEASFSFCATRTQPGQNLRVCHAVPARCWFFDMFAAWRTSVNRRCGRWDHRYQYLYSSQQQTAAGRRAI